MHLCMYTISHKGSVVAWLTTESTMKLQPTISSESMMLLMGLHWATSNINYRNTHVTALGVSFTQTVEYRVHEQPGIHSPKAEPSRHIVWGIPLASLCIYLSPKTKYNIRVVIRNIFMTSYFLEYTNDVMENKQIRVGNIVSTTVYYSNMAM